MRRKSERNKAKPAEKKPEPTPKKSRRSSRRRKRSTSRSSSEDSDDVPLKVAPEIVEPKVAPAPVEEPKKLSSHSNSDEDKGDEQPIWKVKTSDASSGEIQKLKICLQRPSTTPERTEKSPRRRRGKTSSQSDEASLTPDEKIHKRKTRNSPSLNTSEGSSLDNSVIEAAEKDENLIIIKETNEIIIGKGKLDSSQSQQDSENEKYVQDSQIEENEKESQNELDKKDDNIVESKTDHQDSQIGENTVEKQVNEESSNKQTVTDEVQYSKENIIEDEQIINNKQLEQVTQSEEKIEEINLPKEVDSKDIESASDKTNKEVIKEDSKDVESDSDKTNKEAIKEDSVKNESQQTPVVEEDKEEETKCFEMDSTILNYSAVSEENNTSTEAKNTTVEEDSITSSVTINEKTELPENTETPVEKMEISKEEDSVMETSEKPTSPKDEEEKPTSPKEEEEKPVNKSEESPDVQNNIIEKLEDLDTKMDESSTKLNESNEKLETNEEIKEPTKMEETTESSEASEQIAEVPEKVQEDSVEKPQESVEKLDDAIQEDAVQKDAVQKDAIQEDSIETERETSDDNKLKANTPEPTTEMNKNADTIQIDEDSSEKIVRKRKWGKYKVNLTKEQRITLNSIASFCPFVKMLNVEDLKLEKKEPKEYEPKLPKRDRNKEKDTVQIPSLPKNEDDSEKEISNIGLNRKISIVNDEASKLQPPPSPANNPVSAILYITNLVRPFTLKQLQELLSRTGKIVEDGFWTDKIKSKCYVEYETEEEAENTRNALHGVQWPTGNGKKLVIDFATTESMKAARNVNIEIPAVAKTTPDEIPEKVTENAKKEIVSNDQRWDNQRTTAPIREWDLGKVPQDFRDRSRSKDRLDNRSERAEKRRPSRNESPSNGDQLSSRKKKKDEQTEVKLMDDLFHKTKATPSIYWLPLSPDQIAKKQQQRLQRMAEHKRRMEESRRFDRDRDFGRGGGQRARRRSARYDGD